MVDYTGTIDIPDFKLGEQSIKGYSQANRSCCPKITNFVLSSVSTLKRRSGTVFIQELPKNSNCISAVVGSKDFLLVFHETGLSLYEVAIDSNTITLTLFRFFPLDYGTTDTSLGLSSLNITVATASKRIFICGISIYHTSTTPGTLHEILFNSNYTTATIDRKSLQYFDADGATKNGYDATFIGNTDGGKVILSYESWFYVFTSYAFVQSNVILKYNFAPVADKVLWALNQAGDILVGTDDGTFFYDGDNDTANNIGNTPHTIAGTILGNGILFVGSDQASIFYLTKSVFSGSSTILTSNSFNPSVLKQGLVKAISVNNTGYVAFLCIDGTIALGYNSRISTTQDYDIAFSHIEIDGVIKSIAKFNVINNTSLGGRMFLVTERIESNTSVTSLECLLLDPIVEENHPNVVNSNRTNDFYSWLDFSTALQGTANRVEITNVGVDSYEVRMYTNAIEYPTADFRWILQKPDTAERIVLDNIVLKESRRYYNIYTIMTAESLIDSSNYFIAWQRNKIKGLQRFIRQENVYAYLDGKEEKLVVVSNEYTFDKYYSHICVGVKYTSNLEVLLPTARLDGSQVTINNVVSKRIVKVAATVANVTQNFVLKGYSKTANTEALYESFNVAELFYEGVVTASGAVIGQGLLPRFTITKDTAGSMELCSLSIIVEQEEL